jgi:hypothetical protein
MNCVTEDHKLQGETRIGGEVSRTVNMKKKKTKKKKPCVCEDIVLYVMSENL